MLENQSRQPVFPVTREVFMPYGISARDQPNISPPLEHSVRAPAQAVFFQIGPTPHTFRVSLKALDFDLKTDKVMKLELGADQSHVPSGNATAELKPLAPFQFLGIQGLADL
ncbi:MULTISPECIES: hypothetical protein [Comamonas]|uniref:hypothetical protein n=1 Tax=Comamonas TaxID=283 RepID=UPI0012E7440A|nr:hypothetical protein [Comamonas thiooxydans]MCO8249931.1 hypothetical protein [Comamonas thiooxydans]UBQ44133.1 hypothetical protein LCH15_11960 [Comamonas thiooxydans]